MAHYHLIFGHPAGMPISEIMFDNYEESIVNFVDFSQMLFANYMDKRDPQFSAVAAYQKAIEATENGQSQGAYTGTDTLCIVWMPCEQCNPASMN